MSLRQMGAFEAIERPPGTQHRWPKVVPDGSPEPSPPAVTSDSRAERAARNTGPRWLGRVESRNGRPYLVRPDSHRTPHAETAVARGRRGRAARGRAREGVEHGQQSPPSRPGSLALRSPTRACTDDLGAVGGQHETHESNPRYGAARGPPRAGSAHDRTHDPSCVGRSRVGTREHHAPVLGLRSRPSTRWCVLRRRQTRRSCCRCDAKKTPHADETARCDWRAGCRTRSRSRRARARHRPRERCARDRALAGRQAYACTTSGASSRQYLRAAPITVTVR